MVETFGKWSLSYNRMVVIEVLNPKCNEWLNFPNIIRNKTDLLYDRHEGIL